MTELDPALPPAAVLASLAEPVRRLVQVNTALYQGNWDDLAEDIRRRQAGKPYLFRHDFDEAEALAWARRINAYETARGERLDDALNGEDHR